MFSRDANIYIEARRGIDFKLIAKKYNISTNKLANIIEKYGDKYNS